jgi:hypothetical protein
MTALPYSMPLPYPGSGEWANVARLAAFGYLMATALAGEPIPPGAFIGALTRNIS